MEMSRRSRYRFPTSCLVMVEKPFDDMTGLEVARQGAQDALEIDSLVLVEALILDGHHGVLDHLGDALASDDGAVLGAVQVREQSAVGGVDAGGLGEHHRLLVLQLGRLCTDRGRCAHAHLKTPRPSRATRKGCAEQNNDRWLESVPAVRGGVSACDSRVVT